MVRYNVEFEYKLPEWGSLEVDLDPALDRAEQEEIALVAIKEVFDDIEDINITKVIEIG